MWFLSQGTLSRKYLKPWVMIVPIFMMVYIEQTLGHWHLREIFNLL